MKQENPHLWLVLKCTHYQQSPLDPSMTLINKGVYECNSSPLPPPPPNKNMEECVSQILLPPL